MDPRYRLTHWLFGMVVLLPAVCLAQPQGQTDAAKLRGTLQAMKHFLHGDELAKQNKIREALAEFQQAIRLDPSLPGVRWSMARLLAAQGAMKEATDALRGEVRILGDSKSFLARLDLIDLLKQQRDVDGAIREAQELVRIDKTAGSHSRLADLYLTLKHDRTAAAVEARKTIALDPRNAHARVTLFQIFQEEGRVPEALVHLREAVRLVPTNANWRFNLAVTLADGRDLQGAVREFREVLRLNPKDAKAHHNLGGILRKLKDRPGAIAEFRAAAALEPTSAMRQAALGLILEEDGQLQEALQRYELAVRFDPANTSYRKWQEALRHKLKR